MKNTGDGLLVTFESPSQGIDCSAELRRDLAGVGLTIRGHPCGEVEVREDGDGVGLAVNFAARVQQAAREGAIMHHHHRDLLLGGDWLFVNHGEHALKGIDGAWRLYQLTT